MLDGRERRDAKGPTENIEYPRIGRVDKEAAPLALNSRWDAAIRASSFDVADHATDELGPNSVRLHR